MRRLLATAVSALLLQGAALAGSVDLPVQLGGAMSVPVQSLKERRFATTERQLRDFSCGSAALATLLTHHYGRPVGEAKVFDEMFELGDVEAIRRDGFSLLDMKRYLAAHGLESDGFEASIGSLAEAGIPAIALVNERGYNHFVVVKGVRRDTVLIGDPSGGTRALALDRFEAMRVNAILFVVVSPATAPAFNREVDWAAAPAAPVARGRLDGAAASGLWTKLGGADF